MELVLLTGLPPVKLEGEHEGFPHRGPKVTTFALYLEHALSLSQAFLKAWNPLSLLLRAAAWRVCYSASFSALRLG